MECGCLLTSYPLVDENYRNLLVATFPTRSHSVRNLGMLPLSLKLFYALRAGESFYRPNLPFKKADVILLELTPKTQQQLAL
jgi:hypothetical protein